MPAPAPPKLVQLLGRLRLATPAQIASVRREAVRLAGELPDIESVWVDALARRRFLTNWQAAEINAGRGESLLYGPYCILRPLAGPAFARCFAATHVESTKAVRLYVVSLLQRPLAEVLDALRQLQQNAARLPASVGQVEDFGSSGKSLWIAAPPVRGRPVRDWMIENGRLPAQAVLQLAREMARQMGEFQSQQIVHGDIGARSVWVDSSGEVALPGAGLRGVLRPEEGYSFGDLPPDAYDYLAPERIENGTPASLSSDVFACGSLWWHLLAGRPPFPGGNAIAKLKAVHTGRVVDIRPLSPTVSAVLADVIGECMSRDPRQRPQSFAEIAERLGEPTAAGRALVASELRGPGGAWHGLRSRPRPRRRTTNRPMRVGILVSAIAVVALVGRLAMRPDPQVAVQHAPIVEVATAPIEPAEKLEKVSPQRSEKSVDSMVVPAAAFAPVQEQIVEDLVLPTDAPLRVEQLDLKPRIRVRGRAGKRPTIVVPQRGLSVSYEDVRFEHVDFVWEHPAGEPDSPRDGIAMLNLRSQTIRFEGCSFTSRTEAMPAAIRFSGSRENLPGLGGELTFSDCVCDGLSAVVDVQATSPLSVELHNCLCVAAGPILQLGRAPLRDEAIRLLLDRVTTRGDTAVLHCRYAGIAGPPGAIAITADNNALAGGARAGLVILSGRSRPDALLASIAWSGQGSVVTPQTPIVLWRSDGRRVEPLPDDELDMAGLVRGALEFEGRPEGPPSASRLVRWQVPLRSADPPGVDPDRLSRPLR